MIICWDYWDVSAGNHFYSGVKYVTLVNYKWLIPMAVWKIKPIAQSTVEPLPEQQ